MSLDLIDQDLKRPTEDHAEPLMTLTMLRLKDDGHASYESYAREIVPFLEAVEAEILYLGYWSNALLAPKGHEWDAVLLIRYPSRSAFRATVANPDYERISLLRTELLSEAIVHMTVPSAAG